MSGTLYTLVSSIRLIAKNIVSIISLNAVGVTAAILPIIRVFLIVCSLLHRTALRAGNETVVISSVSTTSNNSDLILDVIGRISKSLSNALGLALLTMITGRIFDLAGLSDKG